MLAVDSSVIIAILPKEAQHEVFIKHLHDASQSFMSATNYVETTMVAIQRLGVGAKKRVDVFLESARIDVVDFTVAQANIAIEAFHTYGKGRHKAGLNFCDCFAYALAMDYDIPLLFKGTDFALTDVKKAL